MLQTLSYHIDYHGTSLKSKYEFYYETDFFTHENILQIPIVIVFYIN